MKTRAELDERRDATVDLHGPGRRLGDPRDHLEGRALARTVTTDDTDGRSARDAERDVLQCEKCLARPQIAKETAPQQRALERRELPPGVLPVDLRDVDELNRARHTAS